MIPHLKGSSYYAYVSKILIMVFLECFHYTMIFSFDRNCSLEVKQHCFSLILFIDHDAAMQQLKWRQNFLLIK